MKTDLSPGRNMDLDKYLTLMNEIKLRTNAVTEIMNGTKTTSYPMTNVEFMCLQIRKILELISMGSLVANKDEFDTIGKKYNEYWNARLILQDIERLNLDFYPKPIVEVPFHEGKVKSRLEDKHDGFLTREEFPKVYEKCGKFMHSYNPFGSHPDVEYYKNNIPIWMDKIIGLLNCHMIKLKNATNFFLIHMKEDRDENAHGYDFGMLSSKENPQVAQVDIENNELAFKNIKSEALAGQQ